MRGREDKDERLVVEKLEWREYDKGWNMTDSGYGQKTWRMMDRGEDRKASRYSLARYSLAISAVKAN